MDPFNRVETILILSCKQIASDSFKNKITYKLLTYKSFNWMQTNELWHV